MRIRIFARALSTVTLAAVTLAGCGGRPAAAPVPTPTPGPAAATPATPPTPSPAPAPSVAAASRFAIRAGPASYDVRSEATIEMTAGPEAERGRETVTTTARVAYDVAAPTRGAVGFTGTVDGLAVQASDRVSGGTPLPGGPVRVRGAIDGRGARVDLDAPVLGCLSPEGMAQAAALAAARETVVRVPAAIAVGTQWRDSATVTTCRGPIGALVATAARYEITAIEGTLVRVRRDATISMRGGGIAGGRSVTLGGGGTGSATLELDAARGRLTRVDGETRTTVTVVLPDGPRQFSQQVRTRVAARDS